MCFIIFIENDTNKLLLEYKLKDESDVAPLRYQHTYDDTLIRDRWFGGTKCDRSLIDVARYFFYLTKKEKVVILSLSLCVHKSKMRQNLEKQ